MFHFKVFPHFKIAEALGQMAWQSVQVTSADNEF